MGLRQRSKGHPPLGIAENKMDICPFKKGDRVTYTPSSKGFASDAMASKRARLFPGHSYVIAEIQDDQYILVEGYVHPGGGIYWSEFSKA